MGQRLCITCKRSETTVAWNCQVANSLVSIDFVRVEARSQHDPSYVSGDLLDLPESFTPKLCTRGPGPKTHRDDIASGPDLEHGACIASLGNTTGDCHHFALFGGVFAQSMFLRSASFPLITSASTLQSHCNWRISRIFTHDGCEFAE